MSELVRDIINLNNLDNTMTEKVYTQFAHQVRTALLDLYASGIKLPLRLTGSDRQIAAFMRALQREKKYMDAYIATGITDSRTLSSKQSLAGAVANFEKETGLRWPFKN